jgi:hypothetical protein
MRSRRKTEEADDEKTLLLDNQSIFVFVVKRSRGG